MKLLNELLNISESSQGNTLVGLTILGFYKNSNVGKEITKNTKDEVWDGDFKCSHNPKLESLEGAPKKVTGHFDCRLNPNLESLEGAPKEVTGYFNCSSNGKLKSLEGSPDKTGNFNCTHNPEISSLKGGPKEVTGYFDCYRNPNLSSLEGAPKTIGGYFDCSHNPKLTSLKGIHKQLTSMNGLFEANFTSIKSHVLGLLLIKGCTNVKLDNKEVEAILNKYLPNTRGNKAVIECQSDLLDADLDDFAEL